MAKGPVYKVEKAPTSGNWKITIEGDDTPLLFTDSKEDAMERIKEMAEAHGGTIKGAKTTKKKPAAKKKRAA